MASNIDIQKKCEWCGKLFIAHKTTTRCCSHHCANLAYMSEEELDRLCGYITEYSLGDTLCEVSPVSVDSALKGIYLMHFGWNIGKAFGKKRIHTATFIKNVFAHALRDIEVSTVERKMSHTESECRIKLDGKIG